jgi:hypothetical protein
MDIKIQIESSVDAGERNQEANTSLIKSPMAGNRSQYNRRKYYSAIKTGFNHLNTDAAAARQSFLRPPDQSDKLPMIFP